MTEQSETYLTVRQLADLLRVSGRHVRNLTAAGKLPCLRLGRALRYDPAAVARACRCGPTSAPPVADRTSRRRPAA